MVDFERRTAEPWSVKRKFAVYIIHEEQSAEIVEKAEMMKVWLAKNTDLTVGHIAIQIDQNEGRDRAVDDAAPSDLKQIKEEVDTVLLIQSAKVMSEPRSIARLYIAATCGIPIVPAVLTAQKPELKRLLYNFETAKLMMEDLPAHIGDDAVIALESALANDIRLGDESTTFEVEDRSGMKAKSAGQALSELLPHIISKPLGLDIAESEIDAQMAEIESALRKGSATGAGPLATPNVSLSTARMTDLKTVFGRLDINGDGSITAEEIMQSLRTNPDMGMELGLTGMTGEDMAFAAGELFATMDVNKDHGIDEEEFIAFFGKISGDQDVEAAVAEARHARLPARMP